MRAQIERLYDVLPVRGGIALRPKTSLPGVRSIEVTGGAIAIDGRAVTGAELRDKLGVDADLILQLSYLDADRSNARSSRPSALLLPKPLHRLPKPRFPAAPPSVLPRRAANATRATASALADR